ncbi:MAG: hypothetical protein Q8S54_17690 [Bacteroidota bacterium]|nr:hypothetical protein [Odoribacter sp.]MDP3645002.1 hypothetical protein [Bacteroidota bacterium]
MKTKIGILVLVLCTSFFTVDAQRRVTTTARATSYDISDNLDLEAVASIFGDSENLEDFERRLNDPKSRISNLDLNQDGYIDYLRVLENSTDRNSVVIIQAVLDQDVYQDVATIEIEKSSNYNHRIQIVGDSYIYGSNYIIEPVFVHTPLIFSFFWGPRYSPWRSPYYWNYYPGWYSYYRPYSPFRYHRHIDVHINRYNTYHYSNNRNFHFSEDNYRQIRRNDYANRYPDRAFSNRHQGVTNRNELIERRPNNTVNRQRSNDVQRSNDRQYQYNRQSNSGRNERQRDVNVNRRPAYQEKSGQAQPRGYSRESNRSRPENNNRQIQQKKESGNQSYDRRPAPERRSVSTPERSTKRIESPQRNTAPREKSGSVSSGSRENRVVKQSSGSSKSSGSSTKEEKKESERRGRR